jgi:hypothetical protein
VFDEAEPGRFTGTRLSAGLREDAPLSLSCLVVMNGSELYRVWGDALYSVRTGKPTFEHVCGKPHFAYLPENADAAEIFSQAMADAAAGAPRRCPPATGLPPAPLPTSAAATGPC